MNDLHQIRALTLKSLVLQARQYKTNICQILFPIILLLFLFILQVVVNETTTDVGKITEHKSPAISLANQVFPMAWMNPNYTSIVPTHFLFTSPDSISSTVGIKNADGTGSGFLNFIPQIPVNRTSSTNSTSNVTTTVVNLPYFDRENNSEDIDVLIYDALGTESHRTALVIGAYEFTKLSTAAASPELEYTIQYDNTSQTDFCSFLNNFGGCEAMVSHYLSSTINSLFIYQVTGGRVLIRTNVQEMPYTSKVTPFQVVDIAGTFFFPFILVLLLPVFMHAIVLEKQGKLREMMKLMGMRMRNYWIVNWAFFFVMYVISVIMFVVMCLILQFRFINSTSPVILFLLFLGWGINLISLAIFLSSFITKSLVAVVSGYLIALFGPTCSILLESLVFRYPAPAWQDLFLLVPSFPMSHLFFRILIHCIDYQCPTTDALVDDIEVIKSIVFMFVDAVWLMLIGLYLDTVIPQGWGIPKSPLFFISWIWEPRLRRYREKKEMEKQQQQNADLEGNPKPQQVEDEDVIEERRRIIDGEATYKNSPVFINNLRKRYAGGKIAVRGLHLAMNENECFGLLGPNGAGKTTTISMLCGMFPPTSGGAWVNGYDIKTQIDKVHLSMGLCPQFDVLWEDLTCAEHLLFYSRLKGMPIKDEKKHVKEILASVGLDKLKGNALVKSLSGGMKRRLSIAISLVGNPKIVMLDEPTTGLDPSSRRHLWDIVMKAKKGKTIILTTHSLEEADILCDRIGIMSKGNLKCIGTSLRLKNKFGEGFRLSINFDEENQNAAMSYVNELLPQAKLLVSFAGNVTYEVPKENLKVSRLFHDMEENKAKHGIKDWALSQTTLEDVFLGIIRQDDIDGAEIKNKDAATDGNNNNSNQKQKKLKLFCFKTATNQ